MIGLAPGGQKGHGVAGEELVLAVAGIAAVHGGVGRAPDDVAAPLKPVYIGHIVRRELQGPQGAEVGHRLVHYGYDRGLAPGLAQGRGGGDILQPAGQRRHRPGGIAVGGIHHHILGVGEEAGGDAYKL